MSDALATVADLETRLGVAVGSLAGADLARALANIADASELVRDVAGMAGRQWTAPAGVKPAPLSVQVVVVVAAKRTYENPSGYAGESVGPYSWQADQTAIGPYLTDRERKTVELAAQRANAAGGTWTGTGSVRTPAATFRTTSDLSPWEWTL
jgi:hypothetical protein